MKLSGFGYKNAWFAARDCDPQALGKALSLERAGSCSWERGINVAYQRTSKLIFIPPEIDGWILAIGTAFFDLVDDERFPQLTERLSRDLGCEVQHFATHRVVETHSWARATPDGLQRAYMYIGSSGRTAVDIGELSHEEEELGFRFFDERSQEATLDAYWERNDLEFPNEGHVMRLAALWSIDPTSLEGREVDCSEGSLWRSAAASPSGRKIQPSSQRPPKRWWKLW
jgi:hypothetical protein